MQFLGFGDGSDGDAVLSGTETPIDSSCTGSVGSNTLTVGGGLSFAAGQIVYIHKTRGSTTTPVGTWEFAKVSGYSGTTLTLETKLINAYQDSGANQSQVRVLKQYRSVLISGTLTAKQWNGDVGGILGFLCSGLVSVSGSFTSSAKGFRGGAGSPKSDGASLQPFKGEGETAASVRKSSDGDTGANGVTGGGGGGGGDGGSGGGGGGHANAGTGGVNNQGNPGQPGGASSDVASLTIMCFGGGGGGGRGESNNGSTGGNGGIGGNGGGINIIMAREILITGTVPCSGGAGSNTTSPTEGGGAGGGGGGGAILIKSQNAPLGAGLITASAGAGGDGGGSSPAPPAGDGGPGSVGRIRVEACSIDGTTNPAASESEGGHSFCASGGFIY